MVEPLPEQMSLGMVMQMALRSDNLTCGSSSLAARGVIMASAFTVSDTQLFPHHGTQTGAGALALALVLALA